jgi:WD40 repeat protein
MKRLGWLTLFVCICLCVTVTGYAQDAPLWPAEREVITPENASRLTLLAELDMPYGTMSNPTGTQVEFSPDGHTLAASRRNMYQNLRLLQLWDAQTGTLLQSIDMNDHAGLFTTDLVFSPDGSALLSFEGGTQPQIKLLDLQTGQIRNWTFSAPEEYENCGSKFVPEGIFYGIDDTLLAYGYILCSEGYLIWNARNGEVLGAFMSPYLPYSEAFLLSDGRLLHFGRDADNVFLDDLITGRRWLSLEHSETTFSAALSPDNSLLALQNEVHPLIVEIWEVASLNLRQTISVERSEFLFTLAFASDNQLLAGGGPEGVFLWNVETGELITQLDFNSAGSIAFSPDGTLIAVGGLLDVVRVWGVPASS